jgi:dephospho-CoA kinase
MLVIGLTGGIGSGKTVVTDIFARFAVPIIDTDLIARELVQPGKPALEAIAARFGPRCLDANGQLNRSYLRKVVFADPHLRKRLEEILHPRIKTAVRERLKALNRPYCIVVIPLLVETGMSDVVHRILVIDAPESVQIDRVMARDHVDRAQAQQTLTAQASREQRLAIADDTIFNAGSTEDLEREVSALHEKYLALAANPATK